MALSKTFVKTKGGKFVLDGEGFPIAGVNCYYLPHCSDAARNDSLANIGAMGVNVIRSMGFLNSKGTRGTEPCFQFAEAGKITLNEGPDGLQRFDALIHAAELLEFRLVLPLINYWDDLGGMRTYMDWLFPGQNLPVEDFYRRPEARAAYKEWVGHILDRYRDSPAILAWELANEPRCPGAGGKEVLLDWIRDMAQFIRARDANHLIALGDEGFLKHDHAPNHLYTGEYGVDFEATLGVPEIDFGTYHLYPAAAQMNVSLEFGNTWIRDHIASGNRANKPVLLEEYGIKIGDHGIQSESDRDSWYARWLDTVQQNGGGGALLWMVGSKEPSVAGYRDDYTVYQPSEAASLVAHAEGLGVRESFG